MTSIIMLTDSFALSRSAGSSENTVARPAGDGLLDHLRLVGQTKLIGYLPIETIMDVCKADPENLAEEAKDRGMMVLRFDDSECFVDSGALYIYDPVNLQEFLGRRRNKDILVSSGWPLDAGAFVRKAAAEVAACPGPLYDLIALAFDDRRYRSWRTPPGGPVPWQ